MIQITEEAPVYYINDGTKISIINENLDVIEEVDNRELKIMIEYLDGKAKEFDKFRGIKSKNEYIPDIFLDNLLRCAIDDSQNEKYNLTYRIFTCLLIILAETGMRIEELSLLESGQLNTVKVEEREVNYLNFISPKAGVGLSEVKFTYCYMTDLGTSAYRRAEELSNLLIESLSSNVKAKLFLNILKEHFPKEMAKNINIKNVNNNVIVSAYVSIQELGLISSGFLLLRDILFYTIYISIFIVFGFLLFI